MPEPTYTETQEAELIRHIFYGNLDNLPSLASKVLCIFTSSTFTEYCREKHGLEFQVVDMRWGVRDEATDDHKTTELCMQEIDNCQRVSVGPNFVVFLGQKYGYRPLPTKIKEAEFRNGLSISSPDDARLLSL
ncbi:unnamed protein product [Rotaria sp. Silwood2]|nr:unnamed protein product [Rotaria sp. Silwood2]